MRGVPLRSGGVGAYAAAIGVALLLAGASSAAAAKPKLSIGNAEVAEPATSADLPAQASFKVALSRRAKRTVRVAYETVSGTADPSSDYVAASGVAKIAKKKRRTTISIGVLGDDLFESTDETFEVVLSNPARAQIGDGTGIGTILDSDAPAPGLSSLTVSECIPAGGTGQGTVELSGPAQFDTVVALSVSDASVVGVPSTVTVPGGMAAGSFQISAQQAGSASVVATLGVDEISQSVVVNDVSTPCAGPVPHLLLNEVDYDQPNTDTASFIEIFNPVPNQVSLADLAVVGVSGGAEGTGTEYARFNLGGAGTALQPGAFLVVRNPTVLVPAGTLTLDVSGDFVQNGVEGLALIDTADDTLIDALSYEGSITAAQITGFADTVDLTDSNPITQAADSGVDLRSLGRSPSGVDTDNQSNDWVLFTSPTPGAANP